MRSAPRTRRLLPALAAVLLLAAGCGDDGDDVSAPGTTDAPATTSTTAGEDGAEPVGGTPGTVAVRVDFPGKDAPVALLDGVRAAAQERFDRIVFDFGEEAAPGYAIEYVPRPVIEDGSGREIDVPGEFFLQVSMNPASGVDLSGEDAEETYTGPDVVEATGAGVVRAVVRTGDFEALMTWTVGLDRKVPFSHAVLDDPSRIVVDVHVAG